MTSATDSKKTPIGTFVLRSNGQEICEDGGADRFVHGWTVVKPDGSTFGYFSADFDSGVKTFHWHVMRFLTDDQVVTAYGQAALDRLLGDDA